jgi:hypothetical protein
MGAYGADGINVVAAAGEQHSLAAGMASQHAAVRKIAERDPLLQVRAGWWGGIRSHVWPPSRCYFSGTSVPLYPRHPMMGDVPWRIDAYRA